MPTVTEQDYPHGLRCMTCNTELPPGSAYVEKDIGPDWTTPVCPTCG
jgi:hypothetical protein